MRYSGSKIFQRIKQFLEQKTKSSLTLLLCCDDLRDGEACLGVVADAFQDPKTLLSVAPEAGSAVISIDQLRSVYEFLSTSAFDGHKLVTIKTFNQIEERTRGCLLKLLEEPMVPTVFLLLVALPCAIPGTIRSRSSLLYVARQSERSLGTGLPNELLAFYRTVVSWCAGQDFTLQDEGDLDSKSVEKVLLHLTLRVYHLEGMEWYLGEKSALDVIRQNFPEVLFLEKMQAAIDRMRHMQGFSFVEARAMLESLLKTQVSIGV